MKNNKLISVIVPIYNVEKYLAEAIDSILHQTHHNLEILLIDDGSTDKSGLICDEYAKHDQRIIVKHTPNRGVSAARNKGIDLATGDYISFIDPDDYIAPCMYQNMLDAAIKHNVSIVQCGYKKIYPSQEITYTNPTETIEGQYVFSRYIKALGITSIVCDKLYDAHIFNNNTKVIRFPVGMRMEDAYILIDIFANKENNIRIIEDIYYSYRVQPDSVMNKNFDLKFMKSSFMQYAHRSDIAQKLYPELYPLALKQLASDFLQYYRLIYKGRAIGSDGDKEIMYNELRIWQKRYITKIPLCKTKLYILILNVFPRLARFLV